MSKADRVFAEMEKCLGRKLSDQEVRLMITARAAVRLAGGGASKQKKAMKKVLRRKASGANE
jgi:hypothetical protein